MRTVSSALKWLAEIGLMESRTDGINSSHRVRYLNEAKIEEYRASLTQSQKWHRVNRRGQRLDALTPRHYPHTSSHRPRTAPQGFASSTEIPQSTALSTSATLQTEGMQSCRPSEAPSPYTLSLKENEERKFPPVAPPTGGRPSDPDILVGAGRTHFSLSLGTSDSCQNYSFLSSQNSLEHLNFGLHKTPTPLPPSPLSAGSYIIRNREHSIKRGKQ
jgi:hypothetical protein